MKHIASELLNGDAGRLRDRAFTRWMSGDLRQAATDFCGNIGLHAIYCECSPDSLTRYLFWNTPCEAQFEVRSGRTRVQFEAFDTANNVRRLSLLSLHVTEGGIYSAVWISADHFETASAVLASYGITPARRLLEE